jgi:hypothetical protein
MGFANIGKAECNAEPAYRQRKAVMSA